MSSFSLSLLVIRLSDLRRKESTVRKHQGDVTELLHHRCLRSTRNFRVTQITRAQSLIVKDFAPSTLRTASSCRGAWSRLGAKAAPGPFQPQPFHPRRSSTYYHVHVPNIHGRPRPRHSRRSGYLNWSLHGRLEPYSRAQPKLASSCSKYHTAHSKAISEADNSPEIS
jgi:hypothetical protein